MNFVPLFSVDLYTILSNTLSDRGFQYDSLQAKEACNTATKLIEWADSNKSLFALYADQIYKATSNIAKLTAEAKKKHLKMIQLFKELIFSKTYELFWIRFTEAAGVTNSPILAYHVTQSLLHICGKIPKTTTLIEMPELTEDEKAAIKYIGGYIVRTLIQKITKKPTK